MGIRQYRDIFAALTSFADNFDDMTITERYRIKNELEKLRNENEMLRTILERYVEVDEAMDEEKASRAVREDVCDDAEMGEHQCDVGGVPLAMEWWCGQVVGQQRPIDPQVWTTQLLVAILKPMTTHEKKIQTFRDGVKLVALYQATLEQMDALKGTPLYRQSIKKKMRTLETDIEGAIRAPLSALDSTDEEMMTTIQYKVEMILDLTLEELAGLKMAIEEHREVEHRESSQWWTLNCHNVRV